jgi:ABC-type sugar transport system substrate-binding protein
MTLLARRRLVGVLSVGSIAVLVAGCGGGTATTAPADDSPAASPTQAAGGTIAWIAPTSGQAYYDAMTCAVKAAAEEAGFETITQNAPDFDPATYNQLVSAVIQRSPDVLLLDPIAGADATPAMQDAIDQGITVVTVETPTDVEGQAGNVITDPVAFGRLTAATLVENMGESGKVMLMDFQLGSPILDQRAEGIMEELAQYPDIDIVAHEYGGADAAKAAQLTQAVLAKHPDLAGIVPTDTYDMAGSVSAVKQAKKLDQITMIDIDVTPSGIEHLEEGLIEALVVIKPAPYGREAVRVAVDALNGVENPDPLILEDSFLVVTEENASVLEEDPDLALASC